VLVVALWLVLKKQRRASPSKSISYNKEEKQMNLQPSPVQNISPEDLIIKITVPEGFNMLGPNDFLRFSEWLSNPVSWGKDAPGYLIEGEVLPHVLGLVVDIKICTDRWYPQSKCFVQADGTFSGTVWIHRSLPSAIFRFDILSSEGKLLKRFDVNVS
jgi:hypothetical protein